MCMSDMAVARKMRSSTLWFFGQENKPVPTGTLRFDESQTVTRRRHLAGITPRTSHRQIRRPHKGRPCLWDAPLHHPKAVLSQLWLLFLLKSSVSSLYLRPSICYGG